MNSVDLVGGLFARPALSRKRVIFAFSVALITDAVQIGLGPFGWLFVDDILDVIGMVLISSAIGFHTLLLPTFVIKLIPGPDMLPTWTACTAAVVMLRKRKSASAPPIDIQSEVTSVPASEPSSSPPIISQHVLEENARSKT
jgi:hypothetical protein